MPVVINEFEVVAEAPTTPAASASPESNKDPELPSAFEIERIGRFLGDRALRVWAH